MTSALLTIGQLAKRVGLRTSALRYYEEQGLLAPAGRSAAGYRLFHPQAEQALRFIQQAQRLGFSLGDIKALLQGPCTAEVVALAENRFLELERQLTELMVQRHELEHLLLELSERQTNQAAESLYERLLNQVCADPTSTGHADTVLEWLVQRTGCSLGSAEAQSLLEPLHGCHVHIWQAGTSYHILVVSQEPMVRAALEELAGLESQCQVHPAPQIASHPEGSLLIAHGDNAFLFAQLFLALEKESAPNP